MARYKALQNFRAIKEGVTYDSGQEFEMTVARSDELQSNIVKEFPNAGQVMKRIDEHKKEMKEGK